MRQHSLLVENVAPSPRQGQPHPSLSKDFRAYRIPFASIPRRRISVYFLPPRPKPIYRLPIGGYGKGTDWSNAATFIVGRKRCVFSSPRTAPSLPFQRLSCLPNPSCQHSPQANISTLSPAEAKPHPQAPYRRILARGQAGVMRKHSL